MKEHAMHAIRARGNDPRISLRKRNGESLFAKKAFWQIIFHYVLIALLTWGFTKLELTLFLEGNDTIEYLQYAKPLRIIFFCSILIYPITVFFEAWLSSKDSETLDTLKATLIKEDRLLIKTMIFFAIASPLLKKFL